MERQSGILLAVLAVFLLVLFAGCTQTQPRACTEEAKLCPDGSAVGRTGPNCEFAPCPNITACTMDALLCPDGSYVGRVLPNCEFAPCPTPVACEHYAYYSCPRNCVVCPPCAECSSLGCHSIEFCRELGFNSTWYNEDVDQVCRCPEGYVQEGETCNPACYYSTPPCLAPSIPCSNQH